MSELPYFQTMQQTALPGTVPTGDTDQEAELLFLFGAVAQSV
jgi:hypothetical protein